MTTELRALDESGPAADIYRQLRGLIVAARLGPGERLPTVRQTARDLDVSPSTAAKAYRLLERDGLVVTRTAAGTRVAERAAALPPAVVRSIRQLIDASTGSGAGLDDVIGAIRAMWPGDE